MNGKSRIGGKRRLPSIDGALKGVPPEVDATFSSHGKIDFFTLTEANVANEKIARRSVK